MTRREIVERTITFQKPPRLAMKFDVVGVNDCYDVWTHDPTGWTYGFEGRTADEWGCVWEQSDVSNSGQVHGHPLADLSKLAGYTWPDPDDERRYRGFKEQIAAAEDRFVMFCFGNGIFERLWMLHGMQNTMMAFRRHPDAVREIIQRVKDFHVRVLKNCQEIARGRIDGAAMADDWGVQDRTFVSPATFRDFFKPAYAEWFKEIKALGCHTWMHSCGKINAIVGDLIEAGLEVINNQQPNTVGLEEFGAAYRGKICFEAIVDTQNTLPRGTYEEIVQQAHDICDKYGTPAGGLIPSDYNDAEAIGVTLDRRLVMFRAFAERGNYAGYEALIEKAAKAGGLQGHSWGRASQAKSTVSE